MFKKKTSLAVAAFMSASLMLAGCGLDDSPSTPEPSGDADTATDGATGQDPAAEAVPFTIYTARAKEVADRVVADFEEAHPEYAGKVSVLTMGAQEALERVRAERTNPQGDIWWGGTRQQMQQGAADGVLAPAPQSVIDLVPADYRDPEGLWVGEMKLAELFMINTDVLSVEDAPKDWDDLLEPEMKDQIIIRDVEASGTMRAIYSSMIDVLYEETGSAEAGYEWLAKLDANTKVYAANPTDMYQRLSRQEGSISLWNLQDIMLEKHGDFPMFEPVVPESGAPMLIDGVAKIADGPGGAGADAFLEFLISEEVQAELAEDLFQIPSIDLANEPSWLAELNLTELKVDWDRIAEHETEWIGHWAANIKDKN